MVKYKVSLTKRALGDLDGIYAYIAGCFQEPSTASSLVSSIEKEIMSLEYMPNRCAKRRYGAYANKYRQLFVKNYTVIFRVDELRKEVLVVTVRCSSSNF